MDAPSSVCEPVSAEVAAEGAPLSTTERDFLEKVRQSKLVRAERNKRWRQVHHEALKQKRYLAKQKLLADPEKANEVRAKERLARQKRMSNPLARARIANVRRAWRLKQAAKKGVAQEQQEAPAPGSEEPAAATAVAEGPASVAGEGSKQE
jgi:hypothetical protein